MVWLQCLCQLQAGQHPASRPCTWHAVRQPPAATQPSAFSQDQAGGSQEPARGCKRQAPAWSSVEIVDVIEVWGEASNVHDLYSSHRNVAIYSRMADSLATRGHMRTREQVRCKIKDLRQAYSRACPHLRPWTASWRLTPSMTPGGDRPRGRGPRPGHGGGGAGGRREPGAFREPAQDPGPLRNPTEHIACVVRGRGGLHIHSTWDCRVHHPACNSHPHPSQQVHQGPGGVPVAAPAVPGAPAPHPGPLGPGGAAAVEFGGSGGGGPCPRRPPPDPGGQVPAASCTDPCGRPSSRSSSHPFSPSRFPALPVPPAPSSTPALPRRPRTHSATRRESQQDPKPELSLPFLPLLAPSS
ncbi:uncharacterized protein LOC142829109 [Pelodiscus sinensis]|uniref:uncharacterized protein LOC142829109 n=1 Tax=Pelodiscus sinensis TaxID=13735 RepID=UPI003F6BD7B8